MHNSRTTVLYREGFLLLDGSGEVTGTGAEVGCKHYLVHIR